jgi:hypothetical protein
MAGPLIKPFDRNLLQYSATTVTAGTCYIEARELGKTVCKYILDNEPFEIEHMCRVMKPWIWLKPVLNVAVRDQDKQNLLHKVQTKYKSQLDRWSNEYQTIWTRHWNLENWNLADESVALPIGRINDTEAFEKFFSNQEYPIKVTY